MKFDYSKLKGRMVEKGYIQSTLAKAIGISTASVQSKLAGRSVFNAYELYLIKKALEIPGAEVNDYFFTMKP